MEPLSMYLTRVLSQIGKRQASGLHLTVGNYPVLRINGQFESLSDEKMTDKQLLDEIIQNFLDPVQQGTLKEKKSLVTVLQFSGNMRYKLSAFYQKNMPSLTFHYIPENATPLSEYDFPPSILNFLNARSGLLVIAGHYGSGRTRTSASFIEEFNNQKNKRIVTLEDPIEHIFISKKCIIEQREIGTDVENIEQGLDYCLKEDVDLVYLPESRDLMSRGLGMAMEIASGNALVIMEMNAQSSVGVMETLLHHLERFFPHGSCYHIFSEVLYAIIVQRLLPRRGGGMVIAKEIAVANTAIKSFIREGKLNQIESVIMTSRQDGMLYMPKVLSELVETGEVRQEDTL